MTRIVVISDTHGRSLKELPPKLVETLADADIVVHCGDYTAPSLLDELRRVAKRFIGVYGNIDPRQVREQLPNKAVFEVEGKKIGVIHPSWGGPPWGIEEDIAKEFGGVDIILFGHTHDVCQQTIGGVVFVNPGQAYPSFRSRASAAIVTIGQEGMKVEIRSFK